MKKEETFQDYLINGTNNMKNQWKSVSRLFFYKLGNKQQYFLPRSENVNKFASNHEVILDIMYWKFYFSEYDNDRKLVDSS